MYKNFEFSILQDCLKKIREEKPMVLHFTNYVTMDLGANCVLAVGGSYMLSFTTKDLEELICKSESLVINIGTLDSSFANLCIQAVKMAKTHNKPVVFDPVGAGATEFRASISRDLMPYVDVVKGNAGEIIALAYGKNQSKGVDSLSGPKEAQKYAQEISKKYRCIVVVTGDVDYITYEDRWTQVPFGVPLMTSVVGMGCSLASIIGTFIPVLEDKFESTVSAVRYFAMCGNIAFSKAQSPGQFRTFFVDTLHEADFDHMMCLLPSVEI
ncbi:hydroxyethylthiazole kinase [Holospora curviuscula]|uniref:Hydroxyethylthiazole kinase n=1 Tax=Holospora curviuscula TaxID=1082868 RepID=A0A2S5REF9_9PROT|nr:hydroxyethylthiazole kinase [Holospora curviuscula]PPE05687.1 Hydroxyethylthiazole kinase [Holospora curviuscula]